MRLSPEQRERFRRLCELYGGLAAMHVRGCAVVSLLKAHGCSCIPVTDHYSDRCAFTHHGPGCRLAGHELVGAFYLANGERIPQDPN